MLLTVLAIWLGLAGPAAVFVAALGRSGLREDRAAGHVATDMAVPLPPAAELSAASRC